jgi:hypothetical protein
MFKMVNKGYKIIGSILIVLSLPLMFIICIALLCVEGIFAICDYIDERYSTG